MHFHFRPRNEEPRWRLRGKHKQRFLYRRFGSMFGGIVVLCLITIGILLATVYRPLKDMLPHPGALIMLACGLPLAFTISAAIIGGISFRKISMPLAEVMAAADAVAEGDLSVRVSEDVPGDFGRLARSFNRMTAELARADQQRRNLTADVAHELRTPLHIIQGNLEGIQDGVYEPTSEKISATLDETYLLARLVSDLQTLSLAEAGQLHLHRVDILVADLLADVVASFSGQSEQSGVEIRIDQEGDGSGLEVNVDPDRMDQVLSNLVSNALRYTPQGGKIVLSGQKLSSGEDHADGVRLQVRDTGAGIPAEDLPYIFDRFWRGDKSRMRTSGAGSGLGLAIARQIVRAHGGRIVVESQLGAGTSFKVDLFPVASFD